MKPIINDNLAEYIGCEKCRICGDWIPGKDRDVTICDECVRDVRTTDDGWGDASEYRE